MNSFIYRLLGMTRLPDKMFQAWQAVTGPPAG